MPLPFAQIQSASPRYISRADWLFFSQDCKEANAAQPAADAALENGLMLLELHWPLPSGMLLNWQDDLGNSFRLWHHPTQGISLQWQALGQVFQHVTMPVRQTSTRMIRLFFGWNRPHDSWQLEADDGAFGDLGQASGHSPAIPPLNALRGLCRGQGTQHRDTALLWFGFAKGDMALPKLPWIGQNTPVATPSGAVLAKDLAPGDLVMTLDAGPLPLRDLRHLEMPNVGSHSARVLRAPYFSRDDDLIVSASQKVLHCGPDIEYLFGEDAVLAPASALTDGQIALKDQRGLFNSGISLSFHQPCIIDCGGCGLLMQDWGQPPHALRSLEGHEAAPALALIQQGRRADRR